MLRILRKKISFLDNHTYEVLVKSISSTIVKIVGMVLGLLISIFLGRSLGADGLGIINLSNKVINIFIILSLLGMKQAIIKEVAIAHSKNDYEHIGNVMYTSYWLNGVISILFTVILILLSPWLAEYVFKKPMLTYPLVAMVIAMAPQVFSRIFSSGLIGYRKIWQSNLVEDTLSITFVALFLLMHWLFLEGLTINRVAIYYAIGRLLVTLTVGKYWNSIYRYKFKRELIIKKLLNTSMPMFFASLSTIIIANIDVIILGVFEDAKEIGLYSVALRLALLTSFFLQVTNSSIAPKIAVLFENNKKEELEKMVQQVTRGLGIIGVIQLLIFVFVGKYILMLWGQEFMGSYIILIILGVGQLVNIGTGAVGQILIMSGYEKIQRNISILFLFANLVFNIIFIWLWGAMGASITVAVTYIGINLTKYYYVRKKLKIKILI